MPSHTYDDVVALVKTYLSKPESTDLIDRAYRFANEKHAAHIRASGEPYITHLIEVAYILATFQTSPQVVAAGFLHDTLEDCGVKKEELTALFGSDVAELVEAVTKVGQLSSRTKEQLEAENHRKIFIAMAKDVRVILIKLADRLHNMRTLFAKSPEKQRRIAAETLNVYAPIAHRLGINTIKSELEDISLSYLEPEKYNYIINLLSSQEQQREDNLHRMIKRIEAMLYEHKIPFKMYGRVKNIYSIYKKMYVKERRFEEIYDLHALRIITETNVECYEILGYIHEMFRPIPGRFKDYIAMPKPNLYQSLHTSIISDDGLIFEVQIRTEKMDAIADSGVAAHWRYKEQTDYNPNLEQKEIEEKLHWFRDFISIGDSVSEDAQEYMDTLQKDFFEANVYVFTPKGSVVDLPNGATPIDFAYKIHTMVGNAMIGATVNGVLVPLSTALKTGDVVDIRTSKTNRYPSERWLTICKTNYARNHIRKALLKRDNELNREENIADGRQMLADELRDIRIELKDIMKVIDDPKFLESIGFKYLDDLFVGLVQRSYSLQTLVDKIVQIVRPVTIAPVIKQKKLDKPIATNKEGIIVHGIDSVAVQLAQCCTPIPGDAIIGYISKGLGIKVHRMDCPNITGETQRLIEVDWDMQVAVRSLHPVELIIVAQDRNNLLIEIMNVLNQQNIGIKGVNASANAQYLSAKISVNLLVSDYPQLEQIINVLQTNVPGIISIRRSTKN